MGARSIKWYTHLGDCINTLKAFIGASYQVVPFAFSLSGLGIGLGGVFIVATLTDHCCNLLIDCKNFLIEKVCAEQVKAKNLNKIEEEELRERLQLSMGYGDVGYLVFGPWCYQLIQIAVLFTQFCICVLYVIFIGQTIVPLFPLKEVMQTSNTNETSNSFNESYIGLKPTVTSFNERFQNTNITEIFKNEPELHSFLQLHLSYSPENSTDNKSAIREDRVEPGELTTTSINFTISHETTAPDLRWIIIWILPLFLCTAIVRKVRYIAPLSTIATVALGIGIVSVLCFLCAGFTAKEFKWFKFDTSMPLLFTQMIASYEGIGCILPIHCSMVGCRHLLRYYLHGNVFFIFIVLCTFGTLGYVRFGEAVSPLVVLNFTQHTVLSILVDAVLIVSIVFSYPLQCFPVIEILERYIFGSGSCGKRTHSSKTPTLEMDVDYSSNTPVNNDTLKVKKMESVETVKVLSTVPTWKRNILRIVLTLVIFGLAIALRNSIDTIIAFMGAVGSSLLALALPCLMNIQLRKAEMSSLEFVKDICILIFATMASLSSVVCIIINLINNKSH